MPRFNYTNRRRIYRADVDIELKEIAGAIEPLVNLSLDSYGFADEAPIWLEFYTNSFIKRIQFGTVGNQGFNGPRMIQGAPDASELNVRVKVLHVEADCSQILGVMAGCKPGLRDEKGDQRSESLLDLRSAKLEGETWRLEIQQEREEYPILYIDERLGDYQGLASSSWYQALVMPKVLQEILTNIIVLNEFADADDDSNWGGWLRFARQFVPGSKEIPVVDLKTGDAIELQNALDWIGSVVSSWSVSSKYLPEFKNYLRGA